MRSISICKISIFTPLRTPPDRKRRVEIGRRRNGDKFYDVPCMARLACLAICPCSRTTPSTWTNCGLGAHGASTGQSNATPRSQLPQPHASPRCRSDLGRSWQLPGLPASSTHACALLLLPCSCIGTRDERWDPRVDAARRGPGLPALGGAAHRRTPRSRSAERTALPRARASTPPSTLVPRLTGQLFSTCYSTTTYRDTLKSIRIPTI